MRYGHEDAAACYYIHLAHMRMRQGVTGGEEER